MARISKALAITGMVFIAAAGFLGGAAYSQSRDQQDQDPAATALPQGTDGGFRNRANDGQFQNGRGGGRGRIIELNPSQLSALKALYVAPKIIPHPTGNPATGSKLSLGKKLFFDPGLSANGRLACASCHDVRRAFTDGATLSLGVKGAPLARHTPTIINLAWSNVFFWDGRATSLEQQAIMPISDQNEMGMPHTVMLAHLQENAEYKRLFAQAFPGETVSAATVGKALAAFERNLLFANAPFDRWIGGEENAISEEAKRGFVDFNTRAGCSQCHSGWNFTDGKFHDIGLPSEDIGRLGVEPNPALKYAFKTPGLRNISQRAPYMHTGELGSLQDVLRFYNRGSVFRETRAPEMRNVRARGGRDIIAFLESLNSPTPADLVKLQEQLDRQTGRPPTLPIVKD